MSPVPNRLRIPTQALLNPRQHVLATHSVAVEQGLVLLEPLAVVVAHALHTLARQLLLQVNGLIELGAHLDSVLVQIFLDVAGEAVRGVAQDIGNSGVSLQQLALRYLVKLQQLFPLGVLPILLVASDSHELNEGGSLVLEDGEFLHFLAKGVLSHALRL